MLEGLHYFIRHYIYWAVRMKDLEAGGLRRSYKFIVENVEWMGPIWRVLLKRMRLKTDEDLWIR